jgi:hypothetical protein
VIDGNPAVFAFLDMPRSRTAALETGWAWRKTGWYLVRLGIRDDNLVADNLSVEGVESECRDSYDGAGGNVIAPITATARDDPALKASFREGRPATKAPGLDRVDNGVDFEEGDSVVPGCNGGSLSRSEIHEWGLDQRGHCVSSAMAIVTEAASCGGNVRTHRQRQAARSPEAVDR